MINIDQETVFQAFQAGALNAVTFENDGGFIIPVHTLRMNDCVGKREWLIDARNSVVQNHVGVLPHGAQDLAAGEGGTDRVPVRTGMGSQQEPVTPLNMIENLFQHT